MANQTARVFGSAVLGLGLLISGCGGSSAPEGRAEKKPLPGVLPSYDSGPVFCDVTDDYDLTILDDFELGAARGSWYTNNDVCSRCEDLTQEIERLEGLIADAEVRVAELEDLQDPSNNTQEQIDTITGQAEIDQLEAEIAELEQELENEDLTASERAETEELIAYKESQITELEAQVEQLSTEAGIQDAIDELNADIVEWQEEIERVRAGEGQVQLTATNNLDPTKGIAAPTGSLETCLSLCEIVQAPSFFVRPIPTERIENGRCGSAFALRVRGGHPSTGTRPLNLWGGVMGFQFSPALDASEYEGVAFWGRVGNQSRQSYRVQLTEMHTDESYLSDAGIYDENGELVAPGEQGSLCNPQTPLDDSRSGCDKFGSFVVNNNDWQFFRLPFSEMRQSGWGKPAPYFDISGILSIVFAYEVGSWDIWVDDVALYKRRD